MKKNVYRIFIIGIILTGMLVLSSCVEKEENIQNDSKIEDTEKEEKDNDEDYKEEETVEKETGISIGSVAPNFILENLQGEQVSLDDYRGKTVIVNFWTTTCPYCIKEMPDFQKIYSERKDTDFTILAVNIGESKATVNNFMKKNNYTFPVVFDKKGEVSYMYNITGVPTSIIIDGEGIVRGIRMGPMAYPEIKQRLDAIKG